MDFELCSEMLELDKKKKENRLKDLKLEHLPKCISCRVKVWLSLKFFVFIDAPESVINLIDPTN